MSESITKVCLELLGQLKRKDYIARVQTCPDSKSKVAVVLDGYLSFLFTRCRFLISSFNLSQFVYSGIISGISNDIENYTLGPDIICIRYSSPSFQSSHPPSSHGKMHFDWNRNTLSRVVVNGEDCLQGLLVFSLTI